MTEKIHTHERELWNLTKRLHQRTLTIEYDQNMDEYDPKYYKHGHYSSLLDILSAFQPQSSPIQQN